MQITPGLISPWISAWTHTVAAYFFAEIIDNIHAAMRYLCYIMCQTGDCFPEIGGLMHMLALSSLLVVNCSPVLMRPNVA